VTLTSKVPTRDTSMARAAPTPPALLGTVVSGPAGGRAHRCAVGNPWLPDVTRAATVDTVTELQQEESISVDPSGV
jgi:hypothetical protein